jgi:hypothetical protein
MYWSVFGSDIEISIADSGRQRYGLAPLHPITYADCMCGFTLLVSNLELNQQGILRKGIS